MLHTYGEAKDSSIAEVAGVTVDSTQFLKYVNQAVQLLMERGDWSGTIVPMQVCVKNGCITWPRIVHKVRRLNMCNAQVDVHQSIWWRFVEHDYYLSCCGAGITGRSMSSIGRGPIYNDIPNGEYTVRAYPQSNQDFGKKVTIFGIDTSTGAELRHRDSAGLWQDGIELVLQAPYAESTQYVRGIYRVLKDRTQKPVTLYAYSPSLGTQIDLAKYEPTETNPSYARDRLMSGKWGSGNCSSGSCSRMVNALCKLAFIPVSGVDADNDWILIPSLTALEHAVHSIKLGQAGDAKGRAEYMTLAVNELNHVLDNESPPEESPINSSFAGHECVGYQSVL